MSLSRSELAKYLDVTLLAPTATAADVESLCATAVEVGGFAVCVSPSLVSVAAAVLPSTVALATVCGFPSGAHEATVKAVEAAAAVEAGAAEIDMVVNLALVKAQQWEAVTAEIAAVRPASPVLLKVIIESAALTDDEIVACCRAAEAAGADYVKTSTGFHPSGGASTAAVQLMRTTVGDRLGVKASGGIATTAQALAMIDAGASRLGVSRPAAVLADAPA
ncbi:deoxyribose-phosphate aldolase [Jatrophihabitans sp. GAS493]|uniref:deoxyribose-phosphate aldolase n=1 Tax=Jatrophihabitans sp. GAS493 TaxID=1907575 RepID=UPI000BB9A2F2|nr:deoxyribose-phosphate aldolase [Jatrophihabitans sp. GAS493]SOD71150.1 deoxyribose-phosphate aldolase [Jatrophihabitans sp. GAS493]